MKDCKTCYFVGECRVFYKKEYWGIECPAWVKDKEEWQHRNRLCSEYAHRQNRRKQTEKIRAAWVKGDADD